MSRAKVAAATHVGLVRAENQDAVLVDSWVSSRDGALSLTRDVGSGGRALVLAVCDGLGGHAGGAVASRVAASSLGSADWASTAPDEVVQHIRTAAGHVQRVSDEVGNLRGLGTTVAGVVVGADSYTVFNVGDSSVFRAGDGFLGLLTTPDRRSDPTVPGASVLTQSLSTYTALPNPHVEEFGIFRPVRLILCSDGVTDAIDEQELRAISAKDGRTPAEHTVDALIGAALAAGGPDNVSVVVVDLEPNDEDRGALQARSTTS